MLTYVARVSSTVFLRAGPPPMFHQGGRQRRAASPQCTRNVFADAGGEGAVQPTTLSHKPLPLISMYRRALQHY